MSPIIRTLRTGLFALAATGALGFGALQAFAAPAPAQAAAVCNETACDASCKGRFGPFASGFCQDGQCFCAI